MYIFKIYVLISIELFSNHKFTSKH